jgi:hypothetical protein
MGRYHKITTDARKLLHFNRTHKDTVGKYRVILQHANGNLSTAAGCPSLKEAAALLIETKHKMFAATFTRRGLVWEYKSYDIADAWICQTTSCSHGFMHDGLSCLDKVEQTKKLAIGKCLYVMCGAEFEISYEHRAYCSSKCRKGASNRATYYGEHVKYERHCAYCNEPFTANRQDVICCSFLHRKKYKLKNELIASAKMEDAIKEVMVVSKHISCRGITKTSGKE